MDEAHERTVHTDVLLGLLKGVQARRNGLSNNTAAAAAGDGGAAVAEGTEHTQHKHKKQKHSHPLENGELHSQQQQQDQQQEPQEKQQQAGGTKGQLPPLKLIIMSATLDAGQFIKYLDGARGLLVRGRTYPVDVMYTAQPEDNYLDAAINATLQVR